MKHTKETYKGNIQQNFNTLTNIIILLILVFGGIGYSVGFHFPYEILPGQFANGNYSFNGSLGIGTNSPSSKLDINETNPNNYAVRINRGRITIQDINNVGTTAVSISPPQAEGLFVCVGYETGGGGGGGCGFTDLIISGEDSGTVTVVSNNTHGTNCGALGRTYGKTGTQGNLTIKTTLGIINGIACTSIVNNW